MNIKNDYKKARDMLLTATVPAGTERIPLEQCFARVLAEEIRAAEKVPPFDRSPYDGYAFKSEDTAGASKEHPVILKITETLTAGRTPLKTVENGTTTRIMTGAPIPEGADAVIKFEMTEYTENSVTLFNEVKPGENIIRAGEDVKKGALLASAGTVIDAGLSGVLAAQGIIRPLIFRRPAAALISTGSELTEAGGPQTPGKIRDTNRYSLGTALVKDGCTVNWYGIAGDDTSEISKLIENALAENDIVILTGGVSVGDCDFTPQAMELAGCSILIRGVDIKPGMACCYGIKDGKLICGLSGNPASSLTNYLAVVRPAVRKLAGLAEPIPEEIRVRMLTDYGKSSRGTRFLRGKLSLSSGEVCMSLSNDQGNVVLSSSAGCDVMAVIPAGSGPITKGMVLKGFLI